MKTCGSVYWSHAQAWLSKHADDALRQGHVKQTAEATKHARKLWKALRSAEGIITRQRATCFAEKPAIIPHKRRKRTIGGTK